MALRARNASYCLAWFRLFGGVTGEASRGHSGRCTRGWLVVRLLQRAVLCQVGADDAQFCDAGHDPLRAGPAAARAPVDVEDALTVLC